MPSIEMIPTLVASVATFVLGGIWYSPWLFSKAWQEDTGLSDEQLNAANKVKIFGVSFVLTVIAAAAFSMVLGQTENNSLGYSLHMGVGIGVAWVAMSFGVNYLFELKSLRLWFINAGFHAAQFVLFGLVFGLM